MQNTRTITPDASPQALQQEVLSRCPQVDPKVIQGLFAQLDADYFRLFSAPQIAAHATLLAAVDDQHPVQVRVIPQSPSSAELLLAAYDLFGEFSIITGLMASFGLNILEGQVFSYQRSPGRTAPWSQSDAGGMIIDTFTVQYAAERAFDAAAQGEFVARLTALVQLLRQGQLQQARETLNYRLMNVMRFAPRALSVRLFPIDIRIDNDASPDWTLVHITADDTPGFLYSLSNALAMRNVYIHRVSIRSVQGKVQDELAVGWRRGGKIISADGQRELRLIVALIKQFTHFLPMAPDPVKALRHFDQLLDRLSSQSTAAEEFNWLSEEGPLRALALALGSSDFLWEDFLRLQYATLLPVLKDMDELGQRVEKAALEQRLSQALQAATPAARQALFKTCKDRELFRIDMRHLLHPELPFGAFSEELTDLAEVVVATALALAQQALQARYGVPLDSAGQPCAFAIFGLGKFGGRELGYASDLELLCVYSDQGTTSGPERIAVSEYAEMCVQQTRDYIEARRAGFFEIDLRLRPFGSHGSLATSVAAFRQYYSANGQAAPFERQALIKLRWVAGDAALGQRIVALRDAFVYSPLPFDLVAATQLRQRQIDELVKPGTVDTKYGRGGLIDIEYTVQYLQLEHGATLPTLHTTNTLAAMQALHTAGYLTPTDYHSLQEAYVFLRQLIDALRIVRGHARDLVLPPADSEEFTFLARRLGYWGEHHTPSQLAADITRQMQRAARIYQERFLKHTAGAGLPTA
jgi:[glutamine synthetase] adenylyltransferase / [glutamine synthetase]-adenylyl-L-tyrosine phosphorylase